MRIEWRPVVTLLVVVGATAFPSATAFAQFGPPPVIAAPPAPRAVPTGAVVPLSLREAVALGLRNNRDIKAAYLQRTAQKFDLFVAERRFAPEARILAIVSESRSDPAGDGSQDVDLAADIAWLLPTGGVVDLSWTRAERLDATATDRFDSASLTFRQPLLRGAGLDVNLAPVRVARLREQMNRLSLKSTVSNTVSGIIYSYRSLLQAQEQVRLAELSLERTRALLETNQALIDAGRMAAADIVQTESGLANQEVSLLRARQQKESAQLALLQLLALDPRTNIVAADKVSAEQVRIDLDQVLALGFDARMDLIGQRLSVEQARQALLVARNDRLWDLSVVASVRRREAIDPVLGPLLPETDSRVGVQLAIPLGDYGPRQAELQASTQLRTAELRYEDLTQAVESQIRDAVQTVEMSWLQVEAARRARSLAARALELQQEKLKAGRASNFEVLSFQTNLRAADIEELTASIAYLNALTALDQQIGNTLETWRIGLND